MCAWLRAVGSSSRLSRMVPPHLATEQRCICAGFLMNKNHPVESGRFSLQSPEIGWPSWQNYPDFMRCLEACIRSTTLLLLSLTSTPSCPAASIRPPSRSSSGHGPVDLPMTITAEHE